MSTIDTAEGLDNHPEFELSFLYDDADDPTEVTVFPGDDETELSTQWISMDITHTVPIEDAR